MDGIDLRKRTNVDRTKSNVDTTELIGRQRPPFIGGFVSGDQRATADVDATSQIDVKRQYATLATRECRTARSGVT